MCGITVNIYKNNNSNNNDSDNIIHKNIINRGPDYNNYICINNIKFFSSVLHLRCNNLIKQPLISNNNHILCYNGEIFHHLKQIHDSDTILFMKLLENNENIVKVLSHQVYGPIAFVYYDNKYIWFGRDRLGRRSLVYKCDNDRIQISSVVLDNDYTNWQEVNVNGIYRVNINVDNGPPIIENFPYEDYIYKPLFSNNNNNNITQQLYILLSESIRQRVHFITPRFSNKANVGILFSGGIDCMIMAAFTHIHIPENEIIDLINVAFIGNGNIDAQKICDTVPDRVTSINGLLELQNVFPKRKWRLIEVNIELDELKQQRKHICDLIAPRDTVMDFNIGSILWFGARAKGIIRKYNSKTMINSPLCRYTDMKMNTQLIDNNDNNIISNNDIKIIEQSQCRILLVGIGADEQMAGYRRHRGIYKKSGAQALRNELNADIDRLWWRNLGRDDRCISDLGREARHPYLDEKLVYWLRQLPIEEICKLDLPSGIGDKYLLRQVAKKLGLNYSACLEKRAMQFGTRLANRKFPGEHKIQDIKLDDICHQQFI